MISSWITCPKKNLHPRLRLFCFPYAGGGASMYHTWSNYLPADIEVCPIQLPGRENRLQEAPFNRLLPLVETLASVLRPYLNIPFAFFGHSMGALISFELARQLRRQGDPTPVHLFVSSRPAPQIPDLDPIHQLPQHSFLAELQRRYNGVPNILIQNTEMLQLFLPIMRADMTICETYAYIDEAALNLPISAFGGLQDHHVSQDDIIFWRHQTSETFTLQMLNGDHFFLRDARIPLLNVIAEELIQFL